MLLMLQKWDSEHLEMAMILDEPPFFGYEPISSGGEPWRAGGHLSKASRQIDMNGCAWFFVVYESDPVKTWGQRMVKLTTGGEILREQTHCGMGTGVFTSLHFEVLARHVYGNIVGSDSTAKCELIIDARIEPDPPGSEGVSRSHTRDEEVSYRDSAFHSSQREESDVTNSRMNEYVNGRARITSPVRSKGGSRGGKTVLSCRENDELHSSSGFMNASQAERSLGDSAPHETSVRAPTRSTHEVADSGVRQVDSHETLGHAEPQYQSRTNMYGEIWLAPKTHHGAIVSFLVGEEGENWYVEDGDKYAEKFQFMLTEFQRRSSVSELLARLGFVSGAAPTVKDALQPHLVNVIQAFEDMSKVTKHGRFR